MELIEAKKDKYLWEILVPTVIIRHVAEGHGETEAWPVTTRYHRVWDNNVLELTGSEGLTRPPAAAGQWENPNGKLFKEKMLPVRFMATEDAALEVMKLTKKYYNQEKVMCYVISKTVYVY
tara:strand:- start:173 stop:535 length:363 start_codon:yes stop_codon:yes gene_type:complete